MISNFIRSDVKDFIEANMELFIEGAKEYDGLEITFGTNGEMWGYQTGDNSFTGGAYSFPHWAVTTITDDMTAADLHEEVLTQWEELMCQ